MKNNIIILLSIVATFAATYAYFNFGTPPYLQAARELKSEYRGSPEFNVCMVSATEQCSSQVVGARLSKEHTVNLCDDYTIEDLRQGCKDSFVLEDAVSSNDAGLCKNIANQNIQVSCESEILGRKAISEKSPVPCTMISSDPHKSGCLTNVIVELTKEEKLGDSFCGQINTAGDKKMCVDLLALYQKGMGDQGLNTAIQPMPVPQYKGTNEMPASMPFIMQAR